MAELAGTWERMQTAVLRRTTWAIAASALMHIAVLIVVFLQRPTMPSPLEAAAARPDGLIPVLLLPRAPRAARHVRRAQVERPRRPAQPTDRSQRRPASLPGAPTKQFAEKPPSGVATAPAAAPPTQGPTVADLRLALRRGVAGCANGAALGMTRAEREHCNDQLAAGAADAPVLTIPLEPRILAYYNAVALAKQRDPPHAAMINRAPIPGDSPPQRPGGDHIPLIGCAIPFGPGQRPKLPSHWLTLGPCFIAPPKGPFTQEIDITPP